jgi:hypothetical protein
LSDKGHSVKSAQRSGHQALSHYHAPLSGGLTGSSGTEN